MAHHLYHRLRETKTQTAFAIATSALSIFLTALSGHDSWGNELSGGNLAQEATHASSENDGDAVLPGQPALRVGNDFKMGTSSVEDVIYWGTPEEGPWTTPKDATNLVDVAHAGTHVIGLTADGRVIEWDRTGFVLRGQPQDLTNAISIYGRSGISGSLCANGELSIWKPIVPGSSVFQTNYPGPVPFLGLLQRDGTVFAK